MSYRNLVEPIWEKVSIYDGPEVFLRASVTAVDGSAAVRQSATGAVTDAEGVGRRLAAGLLADGADQMMAATQRSGRDGESST